MRSSPPTPIRPGEPRNTRYVPVEQGIAIAITIIVMLTAGWLDLTGRNIT